MTLRALGRLCQCKHIDAGLKSQARFGRQAGGDAVRCRRQHRELAQQRSSSVDRHPDHLRVPIFSRNAMSREAPRQVWLPGSGVWAALPSPGTGKETHPAAPSSSSGHRREQRREEQQRGRLKRSRERPEGRREDNEHNQQSHDCAAEAAGPPPAGSPPAAAAAAAAEARHTTALTGYALQQDKDNSDIEEVDAPPTCPIVSCLPAVAATGVWAVLARHWLLLHLLAPASSTCHLVAVRLRYVVQCLVDIIELSEKAVVTPCMVSMRIQQQQQQQQQQQRARMCVLAAQKPVLAAREAANKGHQHCLSISGRLSLHAWPFACSTSFVTPASGAGCPITSASAHSARPASAQVGYCCCCCHGLQLAEAGVPALLPVSCCCG